MRSAATSGLSLVLAAWAASCAAPSRSDPVILSTHLGPRIRDLWERCGGYETWLRYAGVVLDYEVEFEDGALHRERLAASLSDPTRVWRLAPDGGAPSEIVLAGAEAVGGPAPRPVAASVPIEDRASCDALRIDFARLSLCHLLQIPFGLASPFWRLRSTTSPGGIESPVAGEIQLEPRSRPLLIGPYLLPAERAARATGEARPPIESIIYASCHPAFPERVIEVKLGGYRSIQGLVVPTRMEHHQRYPAALREPPDPLAWEEPAEPLPRPPLFSERLEGMRFLSRDELDRLTGPEEAGEH